MKRRLKIEVDEYNEKERITTIFSVRAAGISGVACDRYGDKAAFFLSSLEGKQIYPTTRTKKEIFEEEQKN